MSSPAQTPSEREVLSTHHGQATDALVIDEDVEVQDDQNSSLPPPDHHIDRPSTSSSERERSSHSHAPIKKGPLEATPMNSEMAHTGRNGGDRARSPDAQQSTEGQLSRLEILSLRDKVAARESDGRFRVAQLLSENEGLRRENESLRREMQSLRREMQSLCDRLNALLGSSASSPKPDPNARP